MHQRFFQTLGVVLLLHLASLQAVGQQPSDFSWILKHGIYDIETVEIHRNTLEHLKNLVRSSEARTVEEFEKEAVKFGLNIPLLKSVLGLDFGQGSARRDFSEWKKDFLSQSDQRLENDFAFRREVRKISPALMNVLEAAMKQEPGPRLFVWATPSPDAHTFIVHASYKPTLLGEVATVRELVVYSTKDGPVKPAGLASAFSPNMELSAATKCGIIQRSDRSEGFTILMRTDRLDSTPLFIRGVSEEDELRAKLAKLESHVSELEESEVTLREALEAQSRKLAGNTARLNSTYGYGLKRIEKVVYSGNDGDPSRGELSAPDQDQTHQLSADLAEDEEIIGVWAQPALGLKMLPRFEAVKATTLNKHNFTLRVRRWPGEPDGRIGVDILVLYRKKT